MDYKKNIIFALFLSTCLFSQSVDYGFKYKNPVDVGIDQFYLNKIDSLIKSKIEKNEVAGTSAMIVKDGAIVYEKTFGLSDIEFRGCPYCSKSEFELLVILRIFRCPS